MLVVGERGGENRATTSVVSGATIPVPADRSGDIVKLVQSDTSGGQADQVYFGPDYANFVVSTGNGPTASTTESRGGSRSRASGSECSEMTGRLTSLG